MNRKDFIFTFDVQDANPNGDPDAGNLPRIDPETGHGLITDVCLKRKIRNNVQIAYNNESPYRIYFNEGVVLNNLHKEAYEDIKEKPAKNKLPKGLEKAKQVTDFMCSNFFDVRTFGAMMATEVNCGQVRGPVQLSFARSLDPIISQDHCITRQSVTNEKDLEKEKTMGRKITVPYGFYRAYGSISPSLAAQTGFSEDDEKIFFRALENLFEQDYSAARPPGSMNIRSLTIFEHQSPLGDVPTSRLFSLLRVTRNSDNPARSVEDYSLSLDKENVPVEVNVSHYQTF